MSASRSSRRSARLAASALFAGLALLAALSACSAGQISQTSTQVAAVPGANLTIGDLNVDGIALRDLVIAYRGPEGYPQGGCGTAGRAHLQRRAQHGHLGEGHRRFGPRCRPGRRSRHHLVRNRDSYRRRDPYRHAHPDRQGNGYALADGPANDGPRQPRPWRRRLARRTSPSLSHPSSYALLVPGQGASAARGTQLGTPPGQSVHLRLHLRRRQDGDIVVPVGVPQGAQPRPTEHVDVNKVGEGHKTPRRGTGRDGQ